MKIDVNTINILKNFSNINPSIVIKEGNVIETISSTKTIKAKAKVETTFPQRFAMYNLNKLISTLSLCTDPEITFSDKFLTVSDENTSFHLTYSDESTIIKVPDREIKLPSVDVVVNVTNENLKNVEKALGVLGVPEIHIAGDGKVVQLQASDVKNPSGDFYAINIGETDKVFRAVFKSENVKILIGNYTVEICSRGISKWYNDYIEYLIAVESSSTF